MRVVCLGKSKANVPEVTVKGRGAGEVRRAVGGIHSGEFGFIPFLASVWVGFLEPFDTPSSQGLLTLGELLGEEMLGSGRCQAPSRISGQGLNHLPHQNGLGLECSPGE